MARAIRPYSMSIGPVRKAHPFRAHPAYDPGLAPVSSESNCPSCDQPVETSQVTCSACGLPLVVLDRYRLSERLGRGGMASVYGAHHIEDESAVAVKLMRLADHEDWKPRELFERSSRVLRQLDHALLPVVHDFGELDDGGLVLVRERLDGGTLQSWVTEDHWRPSPREVRSLLMSLLEVLAYLHGRVPAVIHRDIKPSNVMFRHGLSRALAKNPPVLADFDCIAAGGHASGAGSNTIVVSPGFTAPEQLAGTSSPASDLFSLGMTMVFAVTHRDPESVPRDEDGRVQLGSALDELDAACARIIRMSIEPDRHARPKSAQWALQQLKGAAATDAGRVLPTPTSAPFPRRGLWAGAVAVMVVGGGLWWATGDEEAPPPPATTAAQPATKSATPPIAPPAPPPPPLRCRREHEADCDGVRDNGCETDLRTSAAHCGRCDRTCAPEQACRTGTCSARPTALAANAGRHCERRSDGSLWCSDDHQAPPRRIELPTPVLSFDAKQHRCAVTEGAQLYCWGDNGLGQTGTGSKRRKEPDPVLLAGLTNVTHVSLGRKTACAVSEGQAYCWGSSLSFGVIGSPNKSSAQTPFPVPGMDEVDALDSGPMHVCVIRGGSVWCWGDGRGGATGDEARPQGSHPTKVEGITDATSLALGRDHSCAVRSTGTVACWGTNSDGQLGNGTTDDSISPVSLSLTEVVELRSDNNRTCARQSSGTVQCWGDAATDDRLPAVVELPGAAESIAMSYDTLWAIVDGNIVTQRVGRASQTRR